MLRQGRVLAGFASVLLAGAVSAPAATLTVTNTNDNLAGSLRQAIQDALSGDTIIFNIPTSDPGYNAVTHVFAISVSGNELAISRDLTIDGAGSKITVQRSGTATIRIFDIAAGAVTLTNLTISNGNPDSSQPHGDKGGGIYNSAVTALLNSTVSGNTARGGGGALYNVAGATATLTNCTFQGNSATNLGSAIGNDGILTLNSTTISGTGERQLRRTRRRLFQYRQLNAAELRSHWEFDERQWHRGRHL